MQTPKKERRLPIIVVGEPLDGEERLNLGPSVPSSIIRTIDWGSQAHLGLLAETV